MLKRVGRKSGAGGAYLRKARWANGVEKGRVDAMSNVAGIEAGGRVLDASSYDAGEHVHDGRATNTCEDRHLNVMRCSIALRVTPRQLLLISEAVSLLRLQERWLDTDIDAVCVHGGFCAHACAD